MLKKLTCYKRLGAQIILLQEMHFASNNHPMFFHRTYKQAFFTLHSSKCRGVAIFLHNYFPFEVQHVFRDPDSRFLILKSILARHELTIANVYTPNVAQATFFSAFLKHLTWHSTLHPIC